VDGRLKVSEYTNKQGEKKFSLDIDANTVQAIGSKNENNQSPF